MNVMQFTRETTARKLELMLADSRERLAKSKDERPRDSEPQAGIRE
jgi:hypothetical protein